MIDSTATIRSMRRDALKIFQAGIAAADPRQCVSRCLTYDGKRLHIALDADHTGDIRTGSWEKIHVIAFGKAACSMAQAVQEILPDRLFAGQGIAVSNDQNCTPVKNFTVLSAGHPLPDMAGLDAARQVAARAAAARPGELLLVLVSGGGSALLPCPVPPVTLEEKIATTNILLASGADIGEINCVRKHLSRLKGGRLAEKAMPADLHALLLSDVIGDAPGTIASGPTVPDDSRFQDAINVFTSRDVWDKVPANVRNLLQNGARGELPETPKTGDCIFAHTGYTLVGSNAMSIAACDTAAAQLHYAVQTYSDRLCGEARNVAEMLVLRAGAMLDRGISRTVAIIAGGETTVTLRGNGRGGRNQEMALAFAIAAKKHALEHCWTFLSGGTDGRDGPTNAAGGMVDSGSLKRMQAAGIDPVASLANNDSYTALHSSRDLLHTGATGTNVADLQILLIHPQIYTQPLREN